MKSAFKMKGSPMERNFGIGSPISSGVGSKNKSDRKSFNIDYDEIKKDGSPNYNDPTDPKSPTYNPKHGGSDFVKPAKKYTSDVKEQAYENAVNNNMPDGAKLEKFIPSKEQIAIELKKIKRNN